MEAHKLTAAEMGQDAGLPERRLWCGVLALMVQDASHYWQGKTNTAATIDEQEESFDAVIQCTWMLKRICEHTGHDAKWISEGFIRWCEDMA